MNCKPGDLVIVVRVSRACDEPYIGRVLTVDRLEEDGETWVTDPELPSLDPALVWGGDDQWVVTWYDWELRPIRDNNGDDETIEWAGLPNQVGVTS